MECYHRFLGFTQIITGLKIPSEYAQHCKCCGARHISCGSGKKNGGNSNADDAENREQV